MTTASLSGTLSKEQLEHYHEHGYVLVRNALSREQVDRYLKRGREMALGDIPAGSEKMVIKDVRVAKGLVTPDDPEKGIWKFMNPDQYDPLFAAYPSTKELLDVVEDIVGPDIKAFLVMMIYKPPSIDFVHPFHQDAAYFAFEPHDWCVGTWVALDQIDESNGTIYVIPGSHRWELKEHVEFPGNAKVFGVEGLDDHPDQISFQVGPGDALFFHSRLMHKTGANSTTNQHRRVLTVHYASSRCKLMKENPYKPIQFRLVRGDSFEGCI